MKKILLTSMATVVFWTPQIAAAGVSVEIESFPLAAKSTNIVAEIDGQRFRIRRSNNNFETSLDDGRTSYFGADSATTQSRLTAEDGSIFAPIKGWIEDEKVSISPPVKSDPLLGYETQTYIVDHSYTTVARLAFIFTRRFYVNAQYIFTVADLGVSPNAVRVMVSRGFGYELAKLPNAFQSFPLKLEGHIQTHDDNGVERKHDFGFSVISVKPWAWPQQK